MAESLGRERWGGESLSVAVRSAGLATSEGRAASELAQKIVAEHGGSLSRHRSRQIQAEDLDWADLVLTMTRSHRDVLRGLKSGDVEIYTLAEFSGVGEEDIVDPYGGSSGDYESAYVGIDECIRAVDTARFRRGPQRGGSSDTSSLSGENDEGLR